LVASVLPGRGPDDFELIAIALTTIATTATATTISQMRTVERLLVGMFVRRADRPGSDVTGLAEHRG
jgi:hypothetical protein